MASLMPSSRSSSSIGLPGSYGAIPRMCSLARDSHWVCMPSPYAAGYEPRTFRNRVRPSISFKAAATDGVSRWPSKSRNVTNSHGRSEEHTSELQSQFHLVCRLLLEKKKHIDHLLTDHSCL